MQKSVSGKKVVVIGAGLSGLSAATWLADKGYSVDLLEKNNTPGGRARMLEAMGFKFDMGPSWYWMPDVMEAYFNRFGKSVNDYFTLQRLDPSYQMIYGCGDVMSIPAGYDALSSVFESMEPGSAAQLDRFLAEAAYKYQAGMQNFVYKPSVSIKEFMQWQLAADLFRLDLLQSFASHIRRYFKHPRILQLLEFPILFLGALPAKTPALYSLMNYADIRLGTWYPRGGMFELVKAMLSLAEEKGVRLQLGQTVEALQPEGQWIKEIKTTAGSYNPDLVIATADYHHVEMDLLPPGYRNYKEQYWQKKQMAPSCLIYYVGVNRKIPRLQHHNLFFESDFDTHAAAIYTTMQWPDDPLFYVCCPSITDPTVAPEGQENLFILIPVAAGLSDTESIKQQYFDNLIRRLEKFTGVPLLNHIVYKKMYAASNFIADYNAYRGNAYGLANTLTQTAFLKPTLRSKKIKNLFFAGQLTVPGPGVPPAIISGQVSAKYAHDSLSKPD